MNGVCFPDGMRLEPLRRGHPRRQFHCGQPQVDDWLASKALQAQEKHLSTTKVLLDETGVMVGYYTLAIKEVPFEDLPANVVRRLPRRVLPVAVLAWLGVNSVYQGKGLGKVLLAQALRNCWEAGHTFAFIAVILDCLNDAAKAFYQQWDFQELPGHPHQLFLSTKRLHAMMDVE